MNDVVNEIRSNPRIQKLFDHVKITPTMAKQLLELNTDNRPLKPGVVKSYAEQMKKGLWAFTGESIGFSRTGKLLNGQHRLHAIVESNVSQVYHLQTGLPDATFDSFDIGKNRSAADVLSIQGHSNAGLRASVIKLIMAYDAKRMKSKNTQKYQRFTNREIASWQGNTELFEQAIKIGIRCYGAQRFVASQTYAAFFYIFARKNQEMAESFFNKLVTGENVSPTQNQAIFYLRQKLINALAQRAKHPAEEKYAWIVKAWNAYRENVPVKRISWSDEEGFPRAK